MKLFLTGYMGSGKSLIGKKLSEKLKIPFQDLDFLIEKEAKKTISQIFAESGEIYFRKLEREILKGVLNSEADQIIALGGGTPCYYDNMELINAFTNSSSFYLKLSVENLTRRLLKEKDHRPMISHLNSQKELDEFVRKHLFERSFYYNQSKNVIDCNHKSPEEIVDLILQKLG
ncbi:shikimate kinase [Gramella sp. AN32]|uniref:Shikimate kinase n=1 Tax=Christiangramia antarctica TaxID=2058158 RepID=A0ABW5X738_9FLAO|nr:shikimate kinase [Gramella sp. AN32]MCM4157641.1 shikimate kinase [Gramella sp. AN32]